ncbi:MAG: plasmid mobilization relaxosome protein MobC [Eubacteriales bacterium]
MQEKRDKGLFVKLSQSEMDMIDKKKDEIPIANRSAYIRKIAIDGLIIHHDITQLNEISKLLRITSNNANQIAKIANGTSHVYTDDIQDMNQNLVEIKLLFGQLLELLTKIENGCRR